jgi:NAD(P)-dependent dehydrogenase (short-subunit alcohol dehydrogenase family)
MIDPAAYRPPVHLLQGRTVLVTGASSGLGREAARAFAAHGATVILHGRATDRLEALYDEINEAAWPEPIILPLDFATASTRQFEAVEHAIRAQTGRLDGILHSAAHFDTLQELQYETLENWLGTLRVNLAAVHALNRACLPLLRASPDAAVIVTGATHGLQPGAFWGAFAVAKSALHAYLAIQTQEWERWPNLRLNLLVPGKVDSPQRARSHPGESSRSRLGLDAVMPYYLYLIGPDSKPLRGEVMRVKPAIHSAR